MPKNLRTPPTGFHLLVRLVAFGVLITPAFATDDIYKYVDDEGTINFTDQWQQIPEKYRSRVQTIGPETAQPPKIRPQAPPPRSEPAPPKAKAPKAAPPVQEPQVTPPFYALWLEQAAALLRGVSFRSSSSAGVAVLVFLVGAFLLTRLISNPALKSLLKAALMLMFVGSASILYLSGPGQHLPAATTGAANPTGTDQSMPGDERGSDGLRVMPVPTALAPARNAPPPYTAGPPAKNFRLSSFSGQVYSKESLKGQPALVLFWAPWCGVCRRELPLLAEFHRQIRPSNLHVLTIGSWDTQENVLAYVNAHPGTFVFPTVYDEDHRLIDAYEFKSTPVYMLLDAQGNILEVHRGGGLLESPKFKQFLEPLILASVKDGTAR